MRPLLVLAPHLTFPARNGADVTHVELGKALSSLYPHVVLVGANETARYEGGQEVKRRAYGGGMRSRGVAVARTLSLRSHYYLERFVTPAFAREARQHLADPAYGTVLHSFLSTAALAPLPDPARTHLAWTHNDEFQWFADLGREARSWAARVVTRAVGATSVRWLQRFLQRHQSHITLLHVTEQDHAGWARHAPAHVGRVVPVGVTVRSAPAPPLPPGAPVRLLFVGALSVRMNYDALAHFAERFWPALRGELGAGGSMTVVGSRPLPEVEGLAAREGWTLRADVDDDELDRLIEGATFSVLPFAYATGAKLKLLKSLAYGVPVLATEAVAAQRALVEPPSLMSDAPEAWAERVAAVRAEGLPAASRARLHALAAAHSWAASAGLIAEAADG